MLEKIVTLLLSKRYLFVSYAILARISWINSDKNSTKVQTEWSSPVKLVGQDNTKQL